MYKSAINNNGTLNAVQSAYNLVHSLLLQTINTADTLSLSSNQNNVDHRKWNFNVIFTPAHFKYIYSLLSIPEYSA